MPRTEHEERKLAKQAVADAAAVEADTEAAAERVQKQAQLQPDIPMHMRGTLTVGTDPKHYIRSDEGKFYLADGPAPGDDTTPRPPTQAELVHAEVQRQLAAAGLSSDVPAPAEVVEAVPEGMAARVPMDKAATLPAGVRAARGQQQ